MVSAAPPASCVGELKVQGSQAEVLEKVFSRPDFYTQLLPTILGRKEWVGLSWEAG